MKATGIVRRIDDLGRVVIPKEIRRTLRIREGDPLEIFVDREGEVILKKYSPIHELGHFAQEYAEALFDSLQQPVIITDRDEVLAVAGESKKDYLNKSISPLLDEIINNRQTVLEEAGEGFVAVEHKPEKVQGYCVSPIIASGDPIGCIAILGRDEKLSVVEEKALETGAGFLAKQME